jgi:hypothetical protein
MRALSRQRLSLVAGGSARWEDRLVSRKLSQWVRILPATGSLIKKRDAILKHPEEGGEVQPPSSGCFKIA